MMKSKVRTVRRLGGTIAALAALVLAPVPTARAALLIDDFELQSQTDLLGGGYLSVKDPYSSITPVTGIGFAAGHESNRAGTFSYQLVPGGTSCYAGVVATFSPSLATMDVSGWAGVRFWARGSGTFRVGVPITGTSSTGNVHEWPFIVGDDWQLVEVPFTWLSQSWGTPVAWDPTTALGILLYVVGAPGDTGGFEVDNLELYAAGEEQSAPILNPVVLEPKVNQVGYLPDAPKVFTITEPENTNLAGAAFEVRPATAGGGTGSSGSTVLAGRLSSSAVDDAAATGERVYQGDFSALKTPGTYVVVVGDLASPPFRIGNDVYNDVYRDAARAFYLIRSGVAIDDAETGIAHPATHLTDSVLRDDPGVQRDLVGGWYNAADFGKWTHMGAISASYMMLLAEIGKTDALAASLNIPESGNSVPDLLDQARWGLEWLLKMQNDDGSVLHKVDSEPNVPPYGVKLEDDPHPRFAAPATSIDAGVFVGVMLQAARVFADVDAAFATKCHDAATRAWTWLRQNPDVIKTDAFYSQSEAWEERLWALGEMVRDSGDATLEAEMKTEIAQRPLDALSWAAPQILGYFTVARASDVDSELREAARSQIVALADSFVSKAQSNGYGVVFHAAEYSWESLETLLHRANALLFAFELTGDNEYRDTALRQLDWAFGTNSLAKSFVSGKGTNAVEHPWHWTCSTMGKLIPGWATGGPNQYQNGADPLLLSVQKRGTPPAKCYVDSCSAAGSWASNEGETTDNAALLFATGYFVSSAGGVGGGGCGCRISPAMSDLAGAIAALLAAGWAILVVRRRRC